MQLANRQLPSQLRRSSRVRKVAAVLLAAYAVKKLSPYVWKRIQVRRARAHAQSTAWGDEMCHFSSRGTRPENMWAGLTSLPTPCTPHPTLRTLTEGRRRGAAGWRPPTLTPALARPRLRLTVLPACFQVSGRQQGVPPPLVPSAQTPVSTVTVSGGGPPGSALGHADVQDLLVHLRGCSGRSVFCRLASGGGWAERS